MTEEEWWAWFNDEFGGAETTDGDILFPPMEDGSTTVEEDEFWLEENDVLLEEEEVCTSKFCDN